MGHYTAFHVDCTVKPEYVEVARGRLENGWGSLALIFPGHPFLREFSRVERCDFIPNGALGHMPDEWLGEVPGPDTYWDFGSKDRLDHKSFFDGRRWAFACTLKNYENTIEAFLGIVLPMIAESVSVCRTQDEWGYETTYSWDGSRLIRGDTISVCEDDHHPWGCW